MVNYANGKIYKIESDLGDKIYIGSTTKEKLCQRMSHHRSDYNYWKNEKNKTYHSSHIRSFDLFDEYGIDNCKITLIEICPCTSKDELHSRESHFIRTLSCVNKVIPDRSKKEYKDDNKELIREKNKLFYNEHKDELYARHKAYYKAYREKNKEKAKVYMANYSKNKKAENA